MFDKEVPGYLEYCRNQKNLDLKTIAAYQIDLNQFIGYLQRNDIEMSSLSVSRSIMMEYITKLHKDYKPRSAKRKLASLKAFFNYLEYEELLTENPFGKIKVRYREPELLPRTIPVSSLEKLLSELYLQKSSTKITNYQRKMLCRDVAVLELLFATGLRVSELCSLQKSNVDLEQGVLRIFGKGAKERMVYFANKPVLDALREYESQFQDWIEPGNLFFYNRLGKRLSEQSVRFMIQRYARQARISEHITPHMFRHTFATLLLEEDVDIRYIQQILGHSSITTTQIYTHVAMEKQRCILTEHHPRNRLEIERG